MESWLGFNRHTGASVRTFSTMCVYRNKNGPTFTRSKVAPGFQLCAQNQTRTKPIVQKTNLQSSIKGVKYQ